MEDEVNAYLPDCELDPYRLDNLLMALEEQGIDLVDKAPPPEFFDPAAANEGKTASPSPPEVGEVSNDVGETVLPPPEATKFSSDPIRMYLSQMAEIPLLSREEEVALAKKIEITRKRFRRSVLTCDFALRKTVETLKKVTTANCHSIARPRCP